MRCRICWKVATAAFLAILVVELIVLVPSYRKYALDWRSAQLDRVSSALTAGVAMLADARSDTAAIEAVLTRISEPSPDSKEVWRFFPAESTKIAFAY